MKMFLENYSGRGVCVAIVDSGVHAAHPHVNGVEQGVAIRADGSLDNDFVDTLGHGTAVTAAIREKAPDALLVAIKVFWHTLSTDAASLVGGIDEACRRGACVINLSLGTSNPAHRALLEGAADRARRHGAFIVAAGEDNGVHWLPGTIAGVVAARLDWDIPRHEYRVLEVDGRPVVSASGYPRDIPGVPREWNLKGLSFAVANTTGFVARALEAIPGATAIQVLELLDREGRPDTLPPRPPTLERAR
jgi:subtilisin family serine protease